MTLTVTFKKLVEDDDKLLIGENNVNEDPHIQDNSKNATVKKSDRFKVNPSPEKVLALFECE